MEALTTVFSIRYVLLLNKSARRGMLPSWIPRFEANPIVEPLWSRWLQPR